MKKIKITHIVYEYNELSQDAQQEAFNNWMKPFFSAIFNKKSKDVDKFIKSEKRKIKKYLFFENGEIYCE